MFIRFYSLESNCLQQQIPISQEIYLSASLFRKRKKQNPNNLFEIILSTCIYIRQWHTVCIYLPIKKEIVTILGLTISNTIFDQTSYYVCLSYYTYQLSYTQILLYTTCTITKLNIFSQILYFST